MPSLPSSENDAIDPPRERTSVRWLEFALIFAIFFVAGGAPAPHLNEAHYLCKAKHYWQPEWCAGDMFLESADAHLAFYWTVGLLTKWFPLGAVAWIGRCAAWALLAWSWQRMSRTVLRGSASAAMAALAFVAMRKQFQFAGEWVIGGVEGKCFAYALVFLGLAALLEGRWRRAWPWFGLAGSMHVLVGGWTVAVAALVWLNEKAARRPTLLSMLPALVLGGALALPGVVPALQLTRGVAVADRGEANQIYVFDRLPHHLAPLSKPWSQMRVRTLRHGLLVLVFYLLWSGSRGSFCKFAAENDDAPERLNRLMRFAWGCLGLSAIGLIWELVCWNHPDWAASLLKYYWFRLADVAVPLAVCLVSGWMIERCIAQRAKYAMAALLLVTLLPGCYLLTVASIRWVQIPPPADRKMADSNAWQEACVWIRENTPKDALFLVPRLSQTFNWNAERRDLVTWKDVPQDAASLFVWRDRFFDAFLTLDEQGEKLYRKRLAKQGTGRVTYLAERYGLDYVVTTAEPPLQLPIVYANRGYVVYEVSR